MNSFANFSFLRDRYKSGFYLAIINKYFVLLAYLSHRSKINFDVIINETIELLFSGKIIELDNFDSEKIYNLLLSKDNTGVLNRQEFLLLGSDDHFVILVFYLYLKREKLLNKKKADLIASVSILYHIQFLYKENDQVLKVWKVSSISLLLIEYPMVQLLDWFNESKKVLQKRIYHAESGKLLTPSVIKFLRDFDCFISEFLLELDVYTSGKVKSTIVSAYSRYKQDLVHFANIKELILVGII